MARIGKPGTVATGVVATLCALIAWFATWWYGDDGPRLPTERSVVEPNEPDALPALVLLSPGTVVDSVPPKGWSDPIIKSILHLASGDIETLPKFARATATRFRTVILADVRRDAERGEFRLRRVGAGLCLTQDGRDRVISTDSLKEQGVKLDMIDGMVLGRAERALGRSELAARTPTFALYDNHVEYSGEDVVHRSLLIRYAFVINPTTGTLRTAFWTMAEKPSDRTTPETLTLLPENLIFRCGIHVSANRLIGKLARSWGFAMTELPPGETIPMPEELKSLALLDQAELDPPALEKAVREALGYRPSPASKSAE